MKFHQDTRDPTPPPPPTNQNGSHARCTHARHVSYCRHSDLGAFISAHKRISGILTAETRPGYQVRLGSVLHTLRKKFKLFVENSICKMLMYCKRCKREFNYIFLRSGKFNYILKCGEFNFIFYSAKSSIIFSYRVVLILIQCGKYNCICSFSVQ